MDTMHDESARFSNSLKGFLGLKTETEDAPEKNHTLSDHRNAHAIGLQALRGRRLHGVARQNRRADKQWQERQQKRATRNHRRQQITGLDNQSTVLGLAQVYLGGAGTEGVRRNVSEHIAAMSQHLARRNHPEVWDEDVLSPEDHLRQITEALKEAHDEIVGKLQEALDAH